jgi:nitroreductase
MSAVLDLLSTRRSVGPALLREPGPDAEALQRLLTIASRVPDHGMMVPWRFIVFQGEARGAFSARMAPIFAEWLQRERAAWVAEDPARAAAQVEAVSKGFTHAPLVVVVVDRAREAEGRPPKWEQTLTVGAVCMTLVTAATAMGFGAAWVTGFVAANRAAHKVLGLAADERVGGVVHIGTPAQRPPERKRPDLANIVTHWTP